MTTTTAMPSNPELVQELRDALFRRPFQPFAIVTRDGKKHRVSRALQAGTDGATIVGIIDNQDRMTYLKLDNVVAIGPIKSRRRGGRRGKST